SCEYHRVGGRTNAIPPKTGRRQLQALVRQRRHRRLTTDIWPGPRKVIVQLASSRTCGSVPRIVNRQLRGLQARFGWPREHTQSAIESTAAEVSTRFSCFTGSSRIHSTRNLDATCSQPPLQTIIR